MRPLLEEAHGPAAARAAQVGLCAHCLGRGFAKVDTGLGNDERGRLLAERWSLELLEPEACHVCEGLFGRLDGLAELVSQALEAWEFATFLVGSRVPPETLEREAFVREEVGGESAESITGELNREIGRRVYEAHPDWEVDFKRPEVTALLDTRFDHVFVQVNSLCLYGRYRKLTRGIPQTHWPCRRCRGVGCTRCELTGKQYETSVEEFVAAPAIEAARASGAKFHGAGREDVDALCLGTGRPFVLELLEPRVRSLDLGALAKAINAHGHPHAQVSPLSVVSKGAVERVKEARGGKAYEADVAFQEPVDGETLLRACEMLATSGVRQRTPSRVSHRRADKVRPRNVARIQVQSHEADGRTARLLIQGDAGLYIKELISGDDGRTEPSLAELVGTGATCTALDVVLVEGPEGFDNDTTEWN